MPTSSHVLLVDDNPQVRDVICNALRYDRDNFEVSLADNGEEAIEILTEHYEDIDVIVLDVSMPITDGYETLRVIKDTEDGFPGPVVIVLTAHTEPENALKSWALGAHYFMTKPVSVPTLLETIKKAVSDRGRLN